MKRSRAPLLALMVALLALASLPRVKIPIPTCSATLNCSACCASQENLCAAGCRGNVNCLNRCWANYMLCIHNC
jgi:hypothetical protein